MTGERDIHLVADEFILGLLDASDHAAVEAALETDPSLRAAVAASQERFLALDLSARPAEISPDMWQRIESSLAAQPPAPPAVGEQAPLTSGPTSPANDNAAARWRLATLSSLAASVLLAVGLGWSLTNAPEPKVIAVLLDTSGTPLALVEDFGDARARVTPLVDFPVPEGRTMQVWTLPSQEMGPVSLGLLASSETAVLSGPVLPAPHEDQLYEITIEPAGGSPTGRPTGPILVKGFAKTPR
jgi:anti-sigma-K factor RskA